MKTYLSLLTVAILCCITGVFYSQNLGLGQSKPNNAYIEKPVEPIVPITSNASITEREKPTEEPAMGTTWSATLNSSLSFIENQGQFNERHKTLGSSILYAIDNNPTLIFFTKNGLSYRFDKKHKNPNRKKGDTTKPKKLVNSDFVDVVWEGANPNPTIVAEEETPHTYTYAVLAPDRSKEYELAGLRGYGKLIYKDLYPNIDVEYVLHPNGGIKYSLILHPGADISNVKITYPEEFAPTLDESGNLYISLSFGDIIEHAPVTFYSANKQALIPSKYVLNGNTVSFDLGMYDNTQTIVIDPWVQTPTLANANCVWECERDATGNVYVIGGDSPMKLQKYSATGVLQWTYNTPWDTANYWLGTLATDLVGNSYVTAGSTAAIRKVATGGTLTWAASGAGTDEYWAIAFNCDQTKLVVGGTRLGFFPPADSYGVIFDINTNNGNVTARKNVGGLRPGPIISDVNEVRSISSSRNAKYYYLTLDTVGAINQNLSTCDIVFNAVSGYDFAYKSENFRPSNGNAGNCAIRANNLFVYTQNGSTVHKRNLATGAIITTAAIPGGINATTLGLHQAGNGGIDIDDCGNVYVGSGDRVIKYDANLNILASVNTPFKVYDVAVNFNGEIVISGGTGDANSGTRTGYVQSVNLSSCAPFTLICCDATICPIGPYCNTDPAFNITPITPGGVFSGPGITNAALGTFNPSVAGPGTHTIIYTLPCGSDSTFITVNACATLSVCVETNGNYTVSGGTPGYTWQRGAPFTNCSGCTFGFCSPFCPGVPDTTWTTFSTSATATPPGTFPIRVTDAAGNRLRLLSAAGLPPCTTCPNITTTITSQTNITCATPTGSATVSASGGTAPYTYNWMPGNLSGATQTGLAAGAYTVIATDAGTCKDTITVTITSSGSIPTVTVTTTPTTCGLSNGTATANVSGGTGPFTYAWSPGTGNTATISNLASGTYTVIVTGAGGCTATASGTVAASSGFTTAVTTTPSTCTANNGTATATNTGGTAPFSYTWTPNVGSTATVSNLAPGAYSVVVRDVNSCTATASGTVTQSSGTLALSLTNPVNPTCAGNDGSITAGLNGGTAPYTVTIDTGGTPIVLNVPFAISQTIGSLPDGTVTVTVVDAQGCQVVNSATLTAPNCCTFTVSAAITQPTCAQSNGSIVITPANGSGNYTYTWGGGAGTGNTASNLAANTYTVTITDNGFANCFIDTSFTLNSNSSLVLSLTNPVNPTCAGNDGSITVGLNGGTAPYTVTIDTGGTPIVINVPFAFSQTVGNLPDGTVNVNVTDAQGCQVNNSATLTAPNCCALTVSAALTQPSCSQSDGQIVITPANGSGNYTYAWAGGVGTGNTASNLGTGTYDVTITDNGFANCFIDTSFTLNNSSNLNFTITAVGPTCAGNDGSITLSVSGSLNDYTIVIDTAGGSYTVITVPTAGNYTFYNFPNGIVYISVSDGLGCVLVDSATIATPNCCTLTASAALGQPTCAQSNGSIVITPANGSGNYTYTWAGGAGTGNTASNLAAGTYDVTITDNGFANCFVDTSFILNSNSSLVLGLTNPVGPTCAGNDGSITVSLSGGTAPYTVTVDTGGGTPFVVTIPAAGTQPFNTLPDGTINISVIDAQGCQVSNSATLAAPNCCAFTITAALTQPTCAQSNGSIVITPANGSGNYTYVWAGGAGPGNTASNLAAGVYNVTITDNGFANCFIDTAFILNSNSSLNLGLTGPINPTCAGNDGSITVSLNGGTAPYTVTIDTGGTPIVLNVPFAFNQAISNLPAGTVNVNVVDAQGCQVNNSATLTAPANCCTFTVSAALTNPTCGVADGGIVITAANGSGNYTYTWAGGAGTGPTASNLLAGNYAVTITDNGFPNCFIDTSFNLVNPNSPTINLVNQTNVECNGDSTGAITIQVNGGTPPYVIGWSNTETILSITNLPSGTYTVTVTDANSCANTASYTITEPSAISLAMSATAIDCTDPLSGSASVVASNGTPPYTYLWSNAATTPTLTDVQVGTYVVTVTDAKGCIAIDSVDVTGDIISSFNLGPNLNICLGDTVWLGTGIVGTVWSTGDTADYINVTNAGTYYGTITNGTCTNSDTVTIFVEQAPLEPELNVYDTLVCEGENLILLVGDEGHLYVWSTGDTAEQIIVDTPGIYVVTAINECGEATAEALVTDENCACRLYLPNAFSPNDDSNNDVFKAYTPCTAVEGYVLKIFDRWGGLVYKSNDLNEVWDGTSKGTACIPGVYVYSLSYLSREDGTRQIHRQKGSVTLIR